MTFSCCYGMAGRFSQCACEPLDCTCPALLWKCSQQDRQTFLSELCLFWMCGSTLPVEFKHVRLITDGLSPFFFDKIRIWQHLFQSQNMVLFLLFIPTQPGWGEILYGSGQNSFQGQFCVLEGDRLGKKEWDILGLYWAFQEWSHYQVICPKFPDKDDYEKLLN